jgi:hypothetical protein
MPSVRDVSERLARHTATRRGFFGRGADLLFGAVAGAAAGVATRPRVEADHILNTWCEFPGPPCGCEMCQSNGICAKPCIILTDYYASGCWVAAQNDATCCDCTCPGIPGSGDCGCGSDYHNDPHNCPS